MLLKVETRGDSSGVRTGTLGEAGQSNWLEWTVISPPVDNMGVSPGVMYHSLSAEALFWWFLYWKTGETVSAPRIYLSLSEKCMASVGIRGRLIRD